MLRAALTLTWFFVLAGCELLAGIPDVRMEAPAPGPGNDGDCASFCRKARDLCDEEFTVYQTEACATACRLYSAEERKCREQALADLEGSHENERYLYCARASLGGGSGQGACGSACKNYCDTMSKVCADHPEELVTYPNAQGMNGEDCEAKCSVIPNKETSNRGGPGGSTFDIAADHEGDTIQCRLVHLTLATVSERSASDHCAHAFISPKPMNNGAMPPWCGGPKVPDPAQTCADYCAVNEKTCTGEHKVYDNAAQCRAACKAFEAGDLAVEIPPGNNIVCRKYHSYNAAVYSAPDMHCPHAGPGGAGVCGDDCESLCQLLEQGCASEYQEKYAGSGSRCRTECDAARKADPMYKDSPYSVTNAKRGHPFSCRLYNATVAIGMSNDAADLCAVAIGDEDCQFPE